MTNIKNQKKNSMLTALLALPLLSLAACAPTTSQMAMGPRTSDVVTSSALGPAPGARFAEDVLRDPAERFALIQRLRVEIVGKTRRVSSEDYLNHVRPVLRRQLETAGMSRSDVDFLLRQVDEVRRS